MHASLVGKCISRRTWRLLYVIAKVRSEQGFNPCDIRFTQFDVIFQVHLISLYILMLIKTFLTLGRSHKQGLLQSLKKCDFALFPQLFTKLILWYHTRLKTRGKDYISVIETCTYLKTNTVRVQCPTFLIKCSLNPGAFNFWLNLT